MREDQKDELRRMNTVDVIKESIVGLLVIALMVSVGRLILALVGG